LAPAHWAPLSQETSCSGPSVPWCKRRMVYRLAAPLFLLLLVLQGPGCHGVDDPSPSSPSGGRDIEEAALLQVSHVTHSRTLSRTGHRETRRNAYLRQRQQSGDKPASVKQETVVRKEQKRTQPALLKHKVMLTCALVGGLGNQMVIFESMVEIANRFGWEAAFLESELHQLNAAFDLSAISFVSLPNDPWQVTVKLWPPFNYEHQPTDKPPDSSKIQGYRSSGYWQDSATFLGLTNRPKQFWKFSDASISSATELLKSHENWVAVHYRHFPSNHVKEFVDAVPSLDALKVVINEAVHCKGKPVDRCPEYCVMVFSNDYDYAMNSLKDSATCVEVAKNDIPVANANWTGQSVEANNYGRDLAAMAMSSRLITTSGTFSLFAGQLHTGEGPVFQAIGQDAFATNVAWNTALAEKDANWFLYSNLDGSFLSPQPSAPLAKSFFVENDGVH